MHAVVKQRSDYTFKHNAKLGRHGWLRLTPAYSVKLVKEIIAGAPEGALILDPFSGTGTTPLVAAESGFQAYSCDINPFLVWLGSAKCREYSREEIERIRKGGSKALQRARALVRKKNWVPDLFNIERWWCGHTLTILASIRAALAEEFGEASETETLPLPWIAFCRLVIETSSAAFNHVSMSFKGEVTTYELTQLDALYSEILDFVISSAEHPLQGKGQVLFSDSRQAPPTPEGKYTHVITSPPYPNRISYIRELRPYMYWTKFLTVAKQAGELDWEAVGGTWGIATSRLQDWSANSEGPRGLKSIVKEIGGADEKNAHLMAKYVWKYFHDMHTHFANLRTALAKGARLYYIVGNSSFYGVQVPSDELLEKSLKALGYSDVRSRIVRKRNCKKELFEYSVEAHWK